MCGLEGRNCIEKNSAKTYNCSTTCVGIYSDVEWRKMLLEEETVITETENTKQGVSELDLIRKELADLQAEVNKLKSNGQGKEEEVDKEKFKMMIAEYRKFKAKNVKHFRLNVRANSSSFGESDLNIFVEFLSNYFVLQVRSFTLQPSNWWRSTLTRPPLTTLRETRRSRRRPS